MAIHDTTRTLLVGLLRAGGLPEDQVQEQAAAKLDAAVARVKPFIKNAQDRGAWATAARDLKGWLQS
jgi:hypothetical protein